MASHDTQKLGNILGAMTDPFTKGEVLSALRETEDMTEEQYRKFTVAMLAGVLERLDKIQASAASIEANTE